MARSERKYEVTETAGAQESMRHLQELDLALFENNPEASIELLQKIETLEGAMIAMPQLEKPKQITAAQEEEFKKDCDHIFQAHVKTSLLLQIDLLISENPQKREKKYLDKLNQIFKYFEDNLEEWMANEIIFKTVGYQIYTVLRLQKSYLEKKTETISGNLGKIAKQVDLIVLQLSVDDRFKALVQFTLRQSAFRIQRPLRQCPKAPAEAKALTDFLTEEEKQAYAKAIAIYHAEDMNLQQIENKSSVLVLNFLTHRRQHYAKLIRSTQLENIYFWQEFRKIDNGKPVTHKQIINYIQKLDALFDQIDTAVIAYPDIYSLFDDIGAFKYDFLKLVASLLKLIAVTARSGATEEQQIDYYKLYSRLQRLLSIKFQYDQLTFNQEDRALLQFIPASALEKHSQLVAYIAESRKAFIQNLSLESLKTLLNRVLKEIKDFISDIQSSFITDDAINTTFPCMLSGMEVMLDVLKNIPHEDVRFAKAQLLYQEFKNKKAGVEFTIEMMRIRNKSYLTKTKVINRADCSASFENLMKYLIDQFPVWQSDKHLVSLAYRGLASLNFYAPSEENNRQHRRTLDVMLEAVTSKEQRLMYQQYTRIHEIVDDSRPLHVIVVEDSAPFESLLTKRFQAYLAAATNDFEHRLARFIYHHHILLAQFYIYNESISDVQSLINPKIFHNFKKIADLAINTTPHLYAVFQPHLAKPLSDSNTLKQINCEIKTRIECISSLLYYVQVLFSYDINISSSLKQELLKFGFRLAQTLIGLCEFVIAKKINFGFPIYFVLSNDKKTSDIKMLSAKEVLAQAKLFLKNYIAQIGEAEISALVYHKYEVEAAPAPASEMKSENQLQIVSRSSSTAATSSASAAATSSSSTSTTVTKVITSTPAAAEDKSDPTTLPQEDEIDITPIEFAIDLYLSIYKDDSDNCFVPRAYLIIIKTLDIWQKNGLFKKGLYEYEKASYIQSACYNNLASRAEQKEFAGDPRDLYRKAIECAPNPFAEKNLKALDSAEAKQQNPANKANTNPNDAAARLSEYANDGWNLLVIDSLLKKALQADQDSRLVMLKSIMVTLHMWVGEGFVPISGQYKNKSTRHYYALAANYIGELFEADRNRSADDAIIFYRFALYVDSKCVSAKDNLERLHQDLTPKRGKPILTQVLPPPPSFIKMTSFAAVVHSANSTQEHSLGNRI